MKEAKLSRGNSKGVGWNISLPPVKACAKGIPCARECYALKAYRQYPQTRDAWEHNLALLEECAATYFRSVSRQVQRARPEFFRIHVSGDFRNQGDVYSWKRVARENPDTRFLAFTKQHALSFRCLPPNLQIVLSMWPGWGNRRKRLPRAWCQDGSETRVPEDAISCPGGCDTCGMCWSLSELGRDVVFKLH